MKIEKTLSRLSFHVKKQVFVMSSQTPTEQGHEKMGANRFGVTTQGFLVAIRTRLLNSNYVAT